MAIKTIKISNNYHYLGEFLDKIETHCLINKGITGCGGTTVELRSKRDSIILCPTKNLVLSKSSVKYLGVTGDTSNSQIISYIKSDIKYKKIIATYDSLTRLMDIITNYSDYFLLVDEYHLLFNDYSFRSGAIMSVLNNFHQFKDWAFLTATPLKEDFILEELKDVDRINYEWEGATRVHINIKDTYFIQKEIINLINIYKDRNLHIFLNSVSTIYKIVEKLDTNDFRVVCSESSKTKIRNFSKITGDVKHINFYTSCSFEGCDIYDPDGYCIIVSDTNISTTVLDISTKVRQVCGRLRNSKYKDTVTFILNINKHRYAGTDKDTFLKSVKESERLGKIKANLIASYSEDELLAELRTYNKESYSNIYLNEYRNKIFYDENLKKMDLYNYSLISEIYNNSISVLTEFKSNKEFKPKIIEEKSKGLIFINNKLKELKRIEYSYEELEKIFKPLFKEHHLVWNHRTSINSYFPKYKKSRKMINRKSSVYYKFTL